MLRFTPWLSRVSGLESQDRVSVLLCVFTNFVFATDTPDSKYHCVK